ncbi:MAG TPA: hypothetical protein VGQ55_15215 [Pyrinomonadaceae bacterium]|nr:hypothetical protein [Pyrinomonadaceae bacterium]
MKRFVALFVVIILFAGLLIFSTPGSAYGQTSHRKAHRSGHLTSVRKHKRTYHRRPTAKKKRKPQSVNTSY